MVFTSVMQGPLTISAAALTFAIATSLVVPWISGRSRSRDSTWNGGVESGPDADARRIARTSLSLFAFPVTNRIDRGAVAVDMVAQM